MKAARAALPKFVQHTTWQVRMYAARAAGALGGFDALDTLSTDPNDNVREAVLTALIDAKRPEAVTVAMTALTRPDYQLVITATKALADATLAPKAPWRP